MKKILSLLVMVVMLAVSVGAYAKDKKKVATAKKAVPAPAPGTKIISTMGGAIVPLNTRMLDAATGFPSAVFVRYHIPIMRNIELAPVFTFDYGFDTQVPTGGDILGLELKYSLYTSPKIKLSLVEDTGFQLIYHPAFAFAIRLSLPEVLITIPINNKFVLDAGFKMPLSFFAVNHGFYNVGRSVVGFKLPNYKSGFLVSIPLLINLGAEYQILNKMNIFLSMDLGPDLLVFKGGNTWAEFRINVRAGISYRF